MNATKFFEKVEEVKTKYENDYLYLGIRFEDKQRNINESITDYSKSNCDREDVRDFPKFGTTEYNEMEDLDGVCAYNLYDKYRTGWTPVTSYYKEEDITDVTKRYLADHCYILGSNNIDYGEDENEIIMINSKVLDSIF